jgi:hypothetical protein
MIVMPAQITTGQVWNAIQRQMFAVVGMVTAKGESRTAGIVYLVQDRKLYFGTHRSAWKTKHLASNPNVSMTVTIAKRIPFMPWVKIPPATVTFSGTASILEPENVSSSIVERLHEGLEEDGSVEQSVIVEVSPQGDFVTYGIGVSLRTMRKPAEAQGRVSIHELPFSTI